jgi:ATP-binding cassette subfamily C protein
MQHDNLPLPDPLLKEIAGLFESGEQVILEGDTSEHLLFHALKMVAHSLGVSLHRDESHHQIVGLSLNQRLEAIAHKNNLRVRRVFLNPGWSEKDNGPLLGFRTEDNRPVALIPSMMGRYQIIDPSESTGPQDLYPEKLETVGEYGYMFYSCLPVTKLNWRDIYKFALQSQKKDFKRLILLQCFLNIFVLFVPIATGILFDTVIPSANMSLFWQMVLGLLTFTLVSTAFTTSQTIALMRLRFKINASLQPAIWDRLLRLPVAFFRKFTAGDLTTRATAVDQIQQELTSATLLIIVGSVFSFFSLIIMFFFDSRLALIAVIVALIMLAISFLVSRNQIIYQRALFNLQGKLTGFLLQILVSINKLRVNKAENRAFTHWADQFVKKTRLYVKARTQIIQLNILFGLLIVLATFFLYIAVTANKGTYSFGNFIIINALYGQFFGAFSSLLSSISNSFFVVPLYERAKPLLHTHPEKEIAGLEPGPLNGKIEVSEVTYRYHPDAPAALVNISLLAKPGELIGIVGKSGAGKSTLLRLLLGFESPEKGQIRYDDHDLFSLNIASLRSQLGVVLQNSVLFPGSILDNMRSVNQHISFDEIWKILGYVGLAEYVRTLPMGLYTLISEGGKTFSGGQRQQLLLARALINNPKILLLDEASSTIDNVTQVIINRHLKQLKITQIVIAQRLQTLKDADRIYVLDQGHMIESGRFKDLSKKSSYFSALLARQV